MLRIATVNVNGLRAATRKGMYDWLAETKPDIVTLQEVRAPDELVAGLMGEEWNVVHAECSVKGRAGVAVASKLPITDFRSGEHSVSFANKGRWIEADVKTGKRKVFTVISAYAHTGDETSTEKMTEKLAWFDAATKRLTELRADGRHIVFTGDLNVAHKEADLKNWKGNIGCAGFLPEEQAYFDNWFDKLGWVDVVRSAHIDEVGPYSWWSYRGKAFDNDAGWRIDYQIVTPQLAKLATEARVDRAPTYNTRWSDHAPVVVDYQL
ncbi:MAG: exodeoxyribonuclease III [Acidimicrobiales bacterium]